MTAIERTGDIYFWKLKEVVARVGLSKSEIYRRMKETDPLRNPFPGSRNFQNDPTKGVFWLSTEVVDWQLREIGLLPLVEPAVADPAGLIG